MRAHSDDHRARDQTALVNRVVPYRRKPRPVSRWFRGPAVAATAAAETASAIFNFDGYLKPPFAQQPSCVFTRRVRPEHAVNCDPLRVIQVLVEQVQ